MVEKSQVNLGTDPWMGTGTVEEGDVGWYRIIRGVPSLSEGLGHGTRLPAGGPCSPLIEDDGPWVAGQRSLALGYMGIGR